MRRCRWTGFRKVDSLVKTRLSSLVAGHGEASPSLAVMVRSWRVPDSWIISIPYGAVDRRVFKKIECAVTLVNPLGTALVSAMCV